MNKRGSMAWGVLLLVWMTGTVSAWSDVIGLANKHPLSESQVGELLLGELRCAACHGVQHKNLLDRSAPDLADVGSRIAPDYLKRYLLSPTEAHPGSAMPDLLVTLPETKRAEVAESLTHFLIAQSANRFVPSESPSNDTETGKELFHTVGCVVCHAPRDETSSETKYQGVVELTHLPFKYSQKSLSEFLFQPLRVRSSGRMPDMKLTQAESRALAGFLLGEQQGKQLPLQPQQERVDMGRKYFTELNCAACHPVAGIAARPPNASLRTADLNRGCLSNSSTNSPRFQLTEPQVKAIRAALKLDEHVDSDQVQVAKTLTAFNCIACHIRDDFGGVVEDRNPYFQTSEKNLGEDGRIPPPLTLLGAKLQPAWLKKVLFDGESIRPYMATRMPQYGEPNLRHLPDLVARLDHLPNVELKIPNPESRTKEERDQEKVLRTAGRELLGQQGLYCIACHNFNGKPAPVNKGMDLMTSYQRLQPTWFNNFVRNPGQYRPRIVMPLSWPGGVAAHEKILDGNTEMQIQAIWYYLSLGTSAADPPGIRRVDTQLSVTEATRVYRGRSSVAGFRGIAVGFPDRLSYAFNAETGSLTAIWLGDFIRVDRGGQGSGGFNPSGQVIPLAQDVSFLAMADPTAPWPLRPVMSKEAPANPNPLYPKNLGYQFKGYAMDDASIPTFIYRCGTVEIEDRSIAQVSDEKQVLIRTLHFNSPEKQTLWLRALTGEIVEESKQVYKSGKLRLTIPLLTTQMRLLSEESKSSELLLKIELPQGPSKLTFTYEPLK